MLSESDKALILSAAWTGIPVAAIKITTATQRNEGLVRISCILIAKNADHG